MVTIREKRKNKKLIFFSKQFSWIKNVLKKSAAIFNTEISVIRALVQPGISQSVCDFLEFSGELQIPGTYELSFPAIAFNVKLLN